jgi:APA family basic amino acid/polyamine antiporter
VLASYLSFFWAPADSGLSRALIITGVTVALTILNVMGVGKAAVACDFFTVAKLVPLLLFVVLGLVFLDSSSYSFSMRPDIRSFSLAVSLLFFAFTGFESAFITAGESRDPQRDFTFALPVALAVVAVIYILVQGVCIGMFPGLANSVKPLADASSRFIGITGAAIITAGMLISAAGTLSGTLLAGPRLFFAMAKHGQFPRAMAKTHRRFHTPHLAILLMASAGLVLALSGTFIYLLTLATISKLATFLATCAALPVLRRQNSRPVSFHLRGGIFLSIVTSAICVWLLANSGLRELRDVGIAAIAGLAFQLIWNLNQRRVNSSLASEGSTPEAGQG